MRSREEIEKGWDEHVGDVKKTGDTALAGLGDRWILEVLLDIRELLAGASKLSVPLLELQRLGKSLEAMECESVKALTEIRREQLRKLKRENDEAEKQAGAVVVKGGKDTGE